MLQYHILKDSEICGMNSDFVNALVGFCSTVSDFNVNNFTSKDTVPPKAKHVLASVLFSKSVQDMKVKFDMTTRQKIVFGCLQASHAHNFLLAIQIEGLRRYMSPVEYLTILKHRIMISIFSIDKECPVCRKACLNTFGEYAVHCKELSDFKYRHDFVKNVLFDIFRRAGVSVKKETPMYEFLD